MFDRKWSLVIGAGLAICLVATLPRVALVSPDRGTSSEEKDSRSERGYLGVSIQDIDRNLRRAMEIPRDVEGVLVSRVERDSPAEKAGIEERDVIMKVDGRSVDEADELTRLVRRAGSGSSMTLALWSGGRIRDVKVQLGEAKERNRFIFGWSGDDDEGGLRTWHWPGDIGHGPRMIRFSPRGMMGVRLQDLNKEIAPFFSTSDEGALIWSVDEDGAGARAGLKAGDVIIEIEGSPVRAVEDALDELSDSDPGETVAVTFLRKGNRQTVRVELEEGSEPGLSRLIESFRSHRPGREPRQSMERLQRELERLQERMERLKKDLDSLND